MATRVLLIAVAVVLAGFFYVAYTNYDAGRASSNGTVYSNDPPASKRKTDDAQAADAKAAAGQTIVYPTPNQTTAAAVPTDQTTQPGTPGGGMPASDVPASDTLSPNSPNGAHFTGTGKYLLYRQGDITYRLDTDTGFSCIIYATDEQWKKPRVYRDGCGKR